VDPISACGKEVFGETQGTTDWFDRGRVLAAGAGEQDGVAQEWNAGTVGKSTLRHADKPPTLSSLPTSTA
jgi:hypothetical protein